MKIESDKYSIRYDSENVTVFCTGTLDLRGKEGYRKIAVLLNQAVDEETPLITLDIQELEFLNSSGITTLGGFIINIRNKGVSKLKIIGSDKYPWQARSMKGLQKLMPSMEQEYK